MLVLVSWAIPIKFCGTDCFQYRHAEEGSGDLGPLYVNLYRNLNRASEIGDGLRYYASICVLALKPTLALAPRLLWRSL